MPDIKEQLLDGVEIDGTTYRVHLDGYNLMPAWSGEAAEWPRREFLYWTDDGDLSALRFDGWKIIFLEQRAEGFKVWSEPYVKLRKPLIENLLMDPFEKMHEVEVGANYEEWEFRHSYLLVPAQAYVAEWLSSFAEFPPRQKAASFSLDGVMEQLEAGRPTGQTGQGNDDRRRGYVPGAGALFPMAETDLGGGGPAAAALGLAALGAVLLLDADEAQAAAVLADDPGALDALVEAAKQLLEALRIANLNPHASRSSFLS